MSIYVTLQDILLKGVVETQDGKKNNYAIRVFVQGTFGEVEDTVIELRSSAKRGDAILINIQDFLKLCRILSNTMKELELHREEYCENFKLNDVIIER